VQQQRDFRGRPPDRHLEQEQLTGHRGLHVLVYLGREHVAILPLDGRGPHQSNE
jgi:hypothetical protein